MACLVNLGAAHRRLEAKQKPGCGRCGYGIWEETATFIATHCCCKMQCLLCSAEANPDYTLKYFIDIWKQIIHCSCRCTDLSHRCNERHIRLKNYNTLTVIPNDQFKGTAANIRKRERERKRGQNMTFILQ